MMLKLSNLNGRVCSDPNALSLNEGPDVEVTYNEVGRLELPFLRDLADYVVETRARDDAR